VRGVDMAKSFELLTGLATGIYIFIVSNQLSLHEINAMLRVLGNCLYNYFCIYIYEGMNVK
jgi:hypothetical protein